MPSSAYSLTRKGLNRNRIVLSARVGKQIIGDDSITLTGTDGLGEIMAEGFFNFALADDRREPIGENNKYCLCG